MIFAASTDDCSLFVFESESQAIAHCEGLDVEARDWLFWDDVGNPLEPDFSVPNKRGLFVVANGRYSLKPAGEDHHAHLSEALDEIVSYESRAPLNTKEAVLAYISK